MPGCSFCRLSALYLFFYNGILFIIHAFLFIRILIAFINGGYDWYQFSWLLKLGTVLQILDVLHARLGLTKVSTFLCLLQVFGRLTMLYIIEGNPNVHSDYTTVLLLLTYTLVEWFRYPYNALSVLGFENSMLTWLRYSAWIAFYPFGLILEAVSLFRSVQYYNEIDVYLSALPIVTNFKFNMGAGLVALLVAFPFLAAFLLYQMAAQRRDKFGASVHVPAGGQEKEIKLD